MVERRQEKEMKNPSECTFRRPIDGFICRLIPYFYGLRERTPLGNLNQSVWKCRTEAPLCCRKLLLGHVGSSVSWTPVGTKKCLRCLLHSAINHQRHCQTGVEWFMYRKRTKSSGYPSKEIYPLMNRRNRQDVVLLFSVLYDNVHVWMYVWMFMSSKTCRSR